MKKKGLLIIALVLLVMATMSTTAMAGGDKVRGEKGDGPVNQVQVQDPPPFN